MSEPSVAGGPPAAALQPTAPPERLLSLDVLRGLALFGVLAVNIAGFSGSEIAHEQHLVYPTGWGGPWPGLLRDVLIESKAAALLAMLFGAGLVANSERIARRGRSYLPFALRRAGALALLGLAHSVLLWNGDILLDYAVIGLLLLPFVSWRPSRVLWAIPILLPVTMVLALPGIRLGNASLSYAQELQHYGAGSWLDALRFRVWELIHLLGPMRAANRLPILTPFFVLGAWFWKQGYLAEPERHRRALVTLCVVCLTIGLIANATPQQELRAWLNLHVPIQPVRILIKAVCFLGRPFLTLGYAAGVLLLLQRPRARLALAVFAPLGRTTLTQYLLQSVVCTWIFNGYGLGLFGKLSINACLALATAIYALQVWSSQLWLVRFRTGPVEWLWRRLVYGSPRLA